jgi:hypothetical protein
VGVAKVFRYKLEDINYFRGSHIPFGSGHLANKTMHWSGSDTKENFFQNPKPGYTDTSITYAYNSYGYREKEFDLDQQRPKILCLGCSYTEGTGVLLDNVWVSLIKKHFATHEVYNLGVGGSSSDTVVRILLNSVELFNPEQVYILWPSVDRFEIFNDRIMAKGPWNYEIGDLPYIHQQNLSNNFYKNKQIVKLLQKVHGFFLFELEVLGLHQDDEFTNLKNKSQARDNHPGPDQHKYIYNQFIKLYNAHQQI